MPRWTMRRYEEMAEIHIAITMNRSTYAECQHFAKEQEKTVHKYIEETANMAFFDYLGEKVRDREMENADG